MIFELDIWSLIVFGIGFWILMDGLVFGVMPQTLRRMLEAMRHLPSEDLRWAGLTTAAIGSVIVFLVIVAPRL